MAAADGAMPSPARIFFAALVFLQLFLSAANALILFALLVVYLLVLCGMVGMGFLKISFSSEAEEGDGVSKREFLRKLLHEPDVLGWLVAAIFVLLMNAGYLVIKYLKGSQGERIGTVIVFVGALGAIAMLFFVVIPAVSLKVWRGMGTVKQQIEDLEAAAPLRQS